MLSVLLLLQLVTSYVVLERTRRGGEAHALDSLAAGARVFERLIEDRERRLLANVAILVSDFGLRRAVATGDRATVESALENHGARVGANLSFLADREGAISALVPATAELEADLDGLGSMIEGARTAGRAAGIGFVDGDPYQLVVVPVKAPRVVGWIGMGFALDGALAGELRELTNLHVSFWSRPVGDARVRLSSTLDRDDRVVLAHRLDARSLEGAADPTRTALDAEWITRDANLVLGDDRRFGAVLQTSYADAMQPVRDQRTELVRYFLIAIAGRDARCGRGRPAGDASGRRAGPSRRGDHPGRSSRGDRRAGFARRVRRARPYVPADAGRRRRARGAHPPRESSRPLDRAAESPGDRVRDRGPVGARGALPRRDLRHRPPEGRERHGRCVRRRRGADRDGPGSLRDRLGRLVRSPGRQRDARARGRHGPIDARVPDRGDTRAPAAPPYDSRPRGVPRLPGRLRRRPAKRSATPRR